MPQGYDLPLLFCRHLYRYDTVSMSSRYAVTIWYFNDVERQQARRRYALQGLHRCFIILVIHIFRPGNGSPSATNVVLLRVLVGVVSIKAPIVAT